MDRSRSRRPRRRSYSRRMPFRKPVDQARPSKAIGCLFGHAVTSKLTIFYHAGAIESNGTPFACGRCADCKGAGGEKHENLSADGAYRYTFNRDSLHFSARAAIEVPFTIAV